MPPGAPPPCILDGMRSATAVLVILLLAGCPSRDPDGAVDAAPGGGSDAAPGATLELTCPVDMSAFPSFPRSCVAASDCAIALHQLDCCGSMMAHGIRADQVDEFSTAESACAAMFPG